MTTIYTKKIGKSLLVTYLLQIFVWLLLPIILTGGDLSFYEDLISSHKNLQYFSVSIMIILYSISYVFVAILFGRQVRKINIINQDSFIIYFFVLPPFNLISSTSIIKMKYHILYDDMNKNGFKISFDNDNDISSIKLFATDWEANDWIFIKVILENNALSSNIFKIANQ